MMKKKNLFMVLGTVSVLVACQKESQKPINSAGLETTPRALSSTTNFRGVNWADPRDNFADDNLVISGLAAGDNYATVSAKANTILTGFQNQAGVNTVRLPINPPTVTTGWWNAYKGSIDKASEKGMKVLVAYWEGASSRNGLVDNMTSFWQMWDVVVSAYQANGNIYFEVFNEPHGYSATDLKNLYASFLSRYPNLPRERIVLDGVGYATNVNAIGSDSRFSNCTLSFHNYTWFGSSNNAAEWEEGVAASINYPNRTIITEFGVPMTTGKNYLNAPGSDREIAFLQGMTNAMRNRGIGGIYWPGLRNGDSYSMFSFNGSVLSLNSSSGLSRLKYGWNTENISQPLASLNGNYRITNKRSGKAAEVGGASTADGAGIIQWDYNGGNNQKWKLAPLGGGHHSIINLNSNKAMEIGGFSTAGGATASQWPWNSGNNQQWQVIDLGFGAYKLLNRNSQHALEVGGSSTSNGASLSQWPWNAGANQVWTISAP